MQILTHVLAYCAGMFSMLVAIGVGQIIKKGQQDGRD